MEKLLVGMRAEGRGRGEGGDEGAGCLRGGADVGWYNLVAEC